MNKLLLVIVLSLVSYVSSSTIPLYPLDITEEPKLITVKPQKHVSRKANTSLLSNAYSFIQYNPERTWFQLASLSSPPGLPLEIEDENMDAWVSVDVQNTTDNTPPIQDTIIQDESSVEMRESVLSHRIDHLRDAGRIGSSLRCGSVLERSSVEECIEENYNSLQKNLSYNGDDRHVKEYNAQTATPKALVNTNQIEAKATDNKDTKPLVKKIETKKEKENSILKKKQDLAFSKLQEKATAKKVLEEEETAKRATRIESERLANQELLSIAHEQKEREQAILKEDKTLANISNNSDQLISNKFIGAAVADAKRIVLEKGDNEKKEQEKLASIRKEEGRQAIIRVDEKLAASLKSKELAEKRALIVAQVAKAKKIAFEKEKNEKKEQEKLAATRKEEERLAIVKEDERLAQVMKEERLASVKEDEKLALVKEGERLASVFKEMELASKRESMYVESKKIASEKEVEDKSASIKAQDITDVEEKEVIDTDEEVSKNVKKTKSKGKKSHGKKTHRNY